MHCLILACDALLSTSRSWVPRAGSGRRCNRPVVVSVSAECGRKWVLGLNQYAHDAGAALLSVDGEQSYIVPKERVTRRKCDGGDTADAVEQVMAAAGCTTSDIVSICCNNHHFRVAPYEHRLPWTVALGIYPRSALSELNLIPGVPKHEISHHMAHAWSAITQARTTRAAHAEIPGCCCCTVLRINFRSFARLLSVRAWSL